MTFGFAFLALFATVGCNNSPTNNQNTTPAVQQSTSATTEETSSHETQAQPTQQAEAQSAPIDVAQDKPSSTIPAFNFYKVKSGISFNNQDITKGRKTVFILFDPGCSHCRTEASALGKNYDKIKDINIYFVSMNDPALMASFLETFAKELVGKPNIEVLYDRNQEFIQKFHVPGQFPANYVYSKDGQLESYWDGDRNINDIVAAYNK